MEYNKKTIDDLLNQMSSTSPMPGGGVGVGLVAAISVSLVLKVCNLSLGKKKYEKYQNLIKETISKLIVLKKDFYELMDSDAEDFKYIESAFKLPKETIDEKEERNKKIEEASKICCNTPRNLILKLKQLLEYIDILEGKTSVLAHSDLVIARILSNASINSSLENININFESITDEGFKKEILDSIK